VDASEKLPKEWFLQDDYDMDTAQYMFDGGRYFYCIFMYHLSIEESGTVGLLKKGLSAIHQQGGQNGADVSDATAAVADGRFRVGLRPVRTQDIGNRLLSGHR
jgi:hypothetical protein